MRVQCPASTHIDLYKCLIFLIRRSAFSCLSSVYRIHTKYSLSRISLLKNIRIGFIEFTIENINAFFELYRMKEADRLRSHHGSRYVRMLCIELAYSFIKLVRTVDNKTVLLALGSLAYSDQRTLGYDMFILINLKNIIISLFQTVDCNYRLEYNQIPVNDFTFVDRRLDMMVGSLFAVSAGFFSFSTFQINFSLHLTRCLLFTL